MRSIGAVDSWLSRIPVTPSLDRLDDKADRLIFDEFFTDRSCWCKKQQYPLFASHSIAFDDWHCPNSMRIAAAADLLSIGVAGPPTLPDLTAKPKNIGSHQSHLQGLSQCGKDGAGRSYPCLSLWSCSSLFRFSSTSTTFVSIGKSYV